MIGAGERDEAFRMLCRRKDMAGIVDADRFISRRVKNQKRLAQLGNTHGEILPGNVVKQGAADAEGSAGEPHLDLAFGFYFFDAFAEQADHMRWIGWRGNGYDRTRLGNAVCRGEHRRTAEAVADQNCGRADLRLQMIRGGNEIVDVG
jgi:hypothetical protein